MTDDLYHVERGRVRLPKDVADQWEKNGYGAGEISADDFYTVLWWIADLGYSIIPDADFDVSKEQES